jgi:hypothetical protein
MAEETTNDIIEVKDMGSWSLIQVRTATVTSENGVVTGRKFHRHVVMPDADLTAEDADVAAIAGQVFTDEVKAAYATHLASAE